MNREQTERFIHENFGGIAQDYPWDDTPEYTVFRHTDNHKWFALIMALPYQTLGINHEGPVDIINLKSDPDLIETLVHELGILPAYHMNKRHWITLLLDGSCSADRIHSLIDLSYRLTQSKSHKPRS